MAADDVEMGGTSMSGHLPAEVLSIVFEYLRPSRSKLPSGKSMHSDDNSLLAICHVCKLWRQVAFAHAALWASEVDVSAHPHPNLTAIVLGYSSPLPLDIKLHYVTWEYKTTVLAQWFQDPHRSRIRSIDIETTGDTATRRLIKVIGSDFPTLRTLKLLNEPEGDPMRHSYEEPPPPDLPTVRALPIRNAPVLERIELRDYVLSWEATQLYAQVTHFEVHMNGERKRMFLPTHAQLHAVVTSMRGLDTLILDNAFPLYAEGAPDWTIPVPATCRSVTLRASDNYEKCRFLASSLALPPGCGLTLAQVCRDIADPSDIVTDFAGPARRPQVANIRTEIDDTVCGEFSVGFDATPYLDSPEKLFPSSIVPAQHVTFLFEATTHALEQDEWDEDESVEASYDRMQAAMTHVDLSDLRVLRIDEMREADEFHLCNGMDAYHGERTTPVLAAAENLETLVIADSSLHILMFLENPNDMTGKLLFPRLATVVIPRDTKLSSAHFLRSYFKARLEDGMAIPAVRAPRTLQGTSFTQDLGEGVVVNYF
ncbi:hypothetical protein PENSPDRAFT_758489 [Peniophora sp. CONT]|nr:hypothetical protein PENSPDRAFT_758489 [Peniophora sp. CONT]